MRIIPNRYTQAEKSNEIYKKYFGAGTGRENYIQYALDYAKSIEKDHSRKISFRVVFYTNEVSEKQANYIINYVEQNNAIQVMKDFYNGERYMFNTNQN